MYFSYKPEDGEPQEWWFDPSKMRSQEAEALEKRTGWDWAEFGMHLQKGSVLARRALLWTYLRRAHHTLRFEDVDFATGEVELEYSREELEQLLDQAVKQPGVSDSDRATAVAQLSGQIEQARPGPGKAPSSSGG